ncbi:MAG: MFS transporter [Thermoplasmata archaeon]|jgi:FSR family fosmidomycin resistance protein-like MFS transporter|nr:MFS transporter [Thermoplasmata archaeon]
MAKDKRLLWVISYHHACNDGTLMALVALLPILFVELDISYYEVGLLGFGLVITVAVQLAVGRIADRAFSHYLLEAGAALMALSFILLLFVQDFAQLFVAVISMRVGASFYHPVGISWITREYVGSELDGALGVQSGIGNLGVIVAMASSGFLGEAFGWKTPCLLWAAMNLAAIVAGMYVVRGHAGGANHSSTRAPISIRQTFRKMVVLTLPIATGGAIYQVTSYFGPVNLTTLHGWTAGSADLLFAVWIAVGTLTSYYYGRLRERFGRYPIMRVGYGVSAVATFALFFLSDWQVTLPLLIIFGAVLFLTYPALFAVVTDATDESERGTAFGILFGFQLGGGAVVVYITGLVADMTGEPAWGFMIVAVMAALSLVTVHLWERGLSLRGR